MLILLCSELWDGVTLKNNSICFGLCEVLIYCMGFYLLSVSRSVLPDPLRLHGLQPTRLLCPWDFPGKGAGVGCHFLLQGIFPTQGSKPGFLHCRQILYQLSYKGSRCSENSYPLDVGCGLLLVRSPGSTKCAGVSSCGTWAPQFWFLGPRTQAQ